MMFAKPEQRIEASMCWPFLALLLAGCSYDPQMSEGTAISAANPYSVYEIGAADFDGDGFEDLWTANHNAGVSLLRSTGDPQEPFETLIEVSQEEAFPALRDLTGPMPRPAGGVLIYWQRNDLKLATGDLQGPSEVRLSVSWPGAVFEGQGDVSIRNGQPTIIIVKLESQQELTFKPNDGKNFTGALVTIEQIIGREPVSVGRAGDYAKEGDSFRLRDFHSVIVNDLNADGRSDFVIYGGGMHGEAGRWVPDAREKVLLSSADGWTAKQGPRKGDCRTQNSRLEGDGIRVVCRGSDTDRLDRYVDGAWVSRPVDKVRVRNSRHLCKQESLPAKSRCTVGDFDHDGADEMVIARHLEGSNYLIQMHEILESD